MMRPNREDEAYAAGRLAGFEEGLEAGALDVERLARSFRATDILEGWPWESQMPEGWRHRQLASEVAAEYARLSQPDEANRQR